MTKMPSSVCTADTKSFDILFRESTTDEVRRTKRNVTYEGLIGWVASIALTEEQRLEEERLASEQARAKAAEAAQKRQEQFEKSAAGRAAKAQIAAAAKQSSNPNRGEPALKWKMG